MLFGRVPAPDVLDRVTEALEAAAGRSVDLVVLDVAPPLLAHEVLATGELLVCRDEDERIRFAVRALARFLDTAALRRTQHRYQRERAEACRAGPG